MPHFHINICIKLASFGIGIERFMVRAPIVVQASSATPRSQTNQTKRWSPLGPIKSGALFDEPRHARVPPLVPLLGVHPVGGILAFLGMRQDRLGDGRTAQVLEQFARARRHVGQQRHCGRRAELGDALGQWRKVGQPLVEVGGVVVGAESGSDAFDAAVGLLRGDGAAAAPAVHPARLVAQNLVDGAQNAGAVVGAASPLGGGGEAQLRRLAQPRQTQQFFVQTRVLLDLLASARDLHFDLVLFVLALLHVLLVAAVGRRVPRARLAASPHAG